jgi:capsular exopolysaccharide synthesis family protein
MSRLYEALSRPKVEPSDSGTVQSVTACPNVVLPVWTHFEVVPPEASRTVEVLGEVAPRPAQIKEPTAAEETRSVVVQASPESRLVALVDPGGLGAEKFRALVTRLEHIRKQRVLRSFQVTSSATNEGKTIVAANLAATLANYSGARTLLIEGDLHRPTLASLFGLGELQGLTDWWVSRNEEVGHFLHQFMGMPLWFAPAGKAYDRPSHILQSTRLAEAFDQLSAQCEWVVVDSTPMLPIVDANLWSRLVDGTLLVVRPNVAPVKALKRGLQALDQPKLIGVVVNDASGFDLVNYETQYYGSPKRGNNRLESAK